MLFFVVILINFNYIRKIIKSSLGATEGLVQQQFGKMAGSVLNWTFGFQMNISAKLKVNTLKSATSPSCKTLYTIYFPNLRWKLLSYFFWIIITENLVWKFKNEPNFVDKLWAEITFWGKFAVKLKPETKRCVKICFAWESELCVEFYF